ncbi:LysR substrate-binding domain-containing protein [Vreelandella neptunia]|uniref:LysR substrate-binding domain-containing protein n=1 Tax=Vreelandella neptunia TaxID=115551 RepID=UPI00315A6698
MHPDLQIEAVAEDLLADLVEEHFDVAIRINPSKDSMLVGRCFARDRLVLVTAPSVQLPKQSGDEPLRIPAIVMPAYREGEVWSVHDGQLSVEPKPVLRLSSLLTVRDAAVAGAGVAMLPQSIIGSLLERGELVSWGAADNEVELWALHTSRRLQSPKVRAFVGFICNYCPNGSFVVQE